MPQDRKRRKSEDGPRATRVTLESQRNWLVIIAELKTLPGKKKREENKRKQPAVGINSGGAVGVCVGGGVEPSQWAGKLVLRRLGGISALAESLKSRKETLKNPGFIRSAQLSFFNNMKKAPN